jgi:sigma-B regulation protein RsbU (phosphoserine phosphatase)
VRTLDLDADELAPVRARRFVGEMLSAAQLTELCDEVQLLTSELVTNALVHTGSTLEVAVSTTPDSVTVRVQDADTGPITGLITGTSGPGDDPRLEPAADAPNDLLIEGGRGLLLVHELADAWGTEHRGGRKAVWFTLSRPEREDARTPAEARAAVHDRADTGGPDPRSRAAQQLSTLLLSSRLDEVLGFEGRVGELLERIIDALDAEGARARFTVQPAVEVIRGRAPATSDRLAGTAELRLGDWVLGTLDAYGPELTGDDAAFLELAAGRLSLLVAEHGLLDTTHRREEKLDFLAEATEMLAGSLNVRLTLTLVTQVVVPRLADWCAAYAVDDRGSPERVTAHHRSEARTPLVGSVLDADKDLRRAIGQAAVGGGPQRLPTTVSVGGQRTHVVVFPLQSRLRVLGVIAFGRAAPLDAIEFVAASELVRRAGLAVDNARLYEEQASVATALQASLLPTGLPNLPHLELAATYHTASPGLSVGGDFYDAFPLEDGSCIAVIGDVCGKGAEAASVAGMTRDLIRLLMQDGLDMAAALRRVNRALIERPSTQRFCTVAVVRLVPGQDTVRVGICLAGHPEPVVLRADGRTDLVGTPGDLVGVLPVDLVEFPEALVELAPGDVLVLYTDGITERRDGEAMFGQVGLRRTLERLAGSDAQSVVRQLEHAARTFTQNPLRDDLAVLAVRHHPD